MFAFDMIHSFLVGRILAKATLRGPTFLGYRNFAFMAQSKQLGSFMKRQQSLLVTLGLILLVSGATMLFTLWASSFSDYMALEDLGLDLSMAPDVFAELTRLSSGERYLGAWGIGSMALGLIVLIVGIALSRRNRS
jgi:hypothetical protein